MNLYAKILNENEFDVSLEKRYGILCRLIADNQHATKEDLIALTNEYKNLKGSASIATAETENIGA